MSLQQSRTGRQYRLWYRHSGQPAIDGIPLLPDYKTLTSEAIITAIGDHHITHMAVDNELPPFDVISPHLTHLRVKGLAGLSELHQLGSLTHLRVLDLSYNDLDKGIPGVICQLTSLESLDLRDCKLVDLPPQLASLTHLRELHLSLNDFHKGIPEVICQLTSLEYLDLRWCELVDLPPQLGSLTHLCVLNLSVNDFHKGIPEVICQLTSLEYLNLEECKLVDLPPQLASLTHLRELDLSDNDFCKGIPEVICQLTSLETLDLRWCKLVDLPPHLSNLNRLKILNLGGNEFTDLPLAVYQLTSLQELDLSLSSQLERIGERIIELTDLTELYCGNCDSLRHPPYDVCEQGLFAVRSYFKSC